MKKQTTITEMIDARIIKVLADYSEYDADELSECMLDIKKLFQEEMSSLAQEVEGLKPKPFFSIHKGVYYESPSGYEVTKVLDQILQLIRERGNRE